MRKVSLLARGIGQKLRNMRKRLGLTQQQLAERMVEKIDYTYIGKIERGELLPSLKMLQRISEGLQIPVDFFFQKETVVELLNILPEDIRDITQDADKIAFFREVKALDKEDVILVAEIMKILNKHRRLRKEREEAGFSLETSAVGIASDRKAPYKVDKEKKKK